MLRCELSSEKRVKEKRAENQFMQNEAAGTLRRIREIFFGTVCKQ